MNHFLVFLGIAAVMQGVLAQSPHAGHAPAEVKPPLQRSAPESIALYRSPFDTYRRFNADEPPVGWSAANDEVQQGATPTGSMMIGKDKAAAAPPQSQLPVHGEVRK